ncbi:MAG: methylmalonyl-CoA mutase family protein [Chitinophagales bacterium]
MSSKLFSDIVPVAKKDWLKQVMHDLKGDDFDKKLLSEVDGIVIQPLYTKDDLPEFEPDETANFLEDFDPEFIEGVEIEGRFSPVWNIAEETTMDKDQSLDEIVIASLKRGSNYLRLSVTENIVWDKVIDEIRKIKYPANFSFNINSDLLDENIANIWRQRVGFAGDRDRLIQSLEFDPIGYWMQTGNIENESRSFTALAEVFFRISGHLQDCKLLKIDAAVDAMADKNSIQQLAMALAITSDYFDRLTKKNVSLEELIHLISFRFSVGKDMFAEIAKLSAFKVLWNNLLKTFIEDIEFIPAPVMQVVVKDVVSQDDAPYQYLLRSTTKAMSAILGGCDVLSISVSGGPENKNDEMLKRTTTHVQNLLRYECHIDKYRDVATGSFYIENLTAEIAEKAWLLFIHIEAEGGFLENWKKDKLASVLAKEFN